MFCLNNQNNKQPLELSSVLSFFLVVCCLVFDCLNLARLEKCGGWVGCQLFLGSRKWECNGTDFAFLDLCHEWNLK